jgi:hypothetical protein
VKEYVVALALAALAAIWQGWITRRVLRSELYERPQKVLQVVMIWALPVVGAVIAFAALRHEQDVRAVMPNEEADEDDIDGENEEAHAEPAGHATSDE